MKYDIGDTGRYLEIRRYRGYLDIQEPGDTGSIWRYREVPGNTLGTWRYREVPGNTLGTWRYREVPGD